MTLKKTKTGLKIKWILMKIWVTVRRLLKCLILMLWCHLVIKRSQFPFLCLQQRQSLLCQPKSSSQNPKTMTRQICGRSLVWPQSACSCWLSPRGSSANAKSGAAHNLPGRLKCSRTQIARTLWSRTTRMTLVSFKKLTGKTGHLIKARITSTPSKKMRTIKAMKILFFEIKNLL